MIARTSLAAAAFLALAGCGGNAPTQDPGGKASPYRLGLVGNAVLVMHPGERRDLRVLLAQDQVGGVADARIHFELADGDAANAALGSPDASTGPDGVASVTFTAGVKTRGFKLIASAPKYGVPEVAFSIQVIPVRRLLQILGGPGTSVNQDGQSATVAVSESSSLALRVRELDADTGAPIAGDGIQFMLPAAVRAGLGSGGNKSLSVATNASGEAQAFLVATAQEPAFQASALPVSGGAPVYFDVSVQAQGPRPCASNDDCGKGQICSDGRCVGGNPGCTSDFDCQFGYQCVGGVCKPPPNATCNPSDPAPCPTGEECACSKSGGQISCACAPLCNPACASGTHCNPDTRTCVPDPPAMPDVTGVWYTKHAYSIRGSLPAVVGDIFKAIRILDQLLTGKLGLPSWLQGIVNAILKQFLPGWFYTVVRIADDVGTFFSYLRAEGAMRLSPGTDAAHVKGTEVWTSLVFYYLELCNGEIGGDPDVPPDCARFDVATTDSDNPSEHAQCKGQTIPAITVQAAPFTASVDAVAGASPARYQLTVGQRKVNLEMGKVVLSAIDLLLSLTTPWSCIDEATDCSNGRECLVDCEGLGSWISDLTGGFLDSGTISAACGGAVTAAGQVATQLIAGIKLKTNVLDFSGHAAIGQVGEAGSVCASQANCAGQLGNDTFDRDLRKNPAARDGTWTGGFFDDVLKNMPGAWESKRQQFH